MFTFQPDADYLKNKVVVVTGSGDGIGKACAQVCAKHGAKVLLLGRSQEKLEEVYDSIEATQPGQAFIHPMDLKSAATEDYQLLSQSLAEKFGQVDVLLHNAGLLGARCPIEFYPESDWSDLMQVNVSAAFSLTKALLPLLRESPSGRIVFTSSSVGRIGRAHWGAYSVSKFAIEGLMQVLSQELRQTSNISVCSLNPGATRTAMRKDAYPAENPMTQPTPAAIMPVYLYLFGPEGSAFNGQAVDVRGFAAKL